MLIKRIKCKLDYVYYWCIMPILVRGRLRERGGKGEARIEPRSYTGKEKEVYAQKTQFSHVLISNVGKHKILLC